MAEFDHKSIDEVIHGRLRLAIMAFLSSVASTDFTTLKAETGATDGNLSVHLRKLEEAGYVSAEKKFIGRKPKTTLKLSKDGRKAWIAYLDRLNAMIDRA